MHAKTKSILLLGTVLLLGIVIGSLLNSWIVDNKIDQMRKQFVSGNFVMSEIEKNVELSTEQKTEVDSVLHKYKPRVARLFIETRLEIADIVDSLSADLKEVLTEEQYDTLKKGILDNRPLLRRRFLE